MPSYPHRGSNPDDRTENPAGCHYLMGRKRKAEESNLMARTTTQVATGRRAAPASPSRMCVGQDSNLHARGTWSTARRAIQLPNRRIAAAPRPSYGSGNCL